MEDERQGKGKLRGREVRRDENAVHTHNNSNSNYHRRSSNTLNNHTNNINNVIQISHSKPSFHLKHLLTATIQLQKVDNTNSKTKQHHQT